MFDGFQKRTERDRSPLGPQPQEGQQILDRALELGAISHDSARTRTELDARKDSNWTALLACGYLREGEPGYYYLANLGAAADRPFGVQSPMKAVLVLIAVIVLVALRTC